MLHDAFRCPFAQPAHIRDCRDEVPLLPCCVPWSLQSYPAPENSQKWEEIQVWLLQLCLQAGTVYQGLLAGSGGQGEMEEGRAGVGFSFTLNIFWRIVPSGKETVQNSQKDLEVLEANQNHKVKVTVIKSLCCQHTLCPFAMWHWHWWCRGRGLPKHVSEWPRQAGLLCVLFFN